jgi:hypothetical protein
MYSFLLVGVLTVRNQIGAGGVVVFSGGDNAEKKITKLVW